jgi:hypothetical protein
MRGLLTSLSIIILLASCKPKYREEEVPSYLRVPTAHFKADISTYGDSTVKFSEIWVTAEGNTLGAYEMPATVPILLEGQKKLTLYGGVKENGISTVRVAYPFFQPIDTFVNLHRTNVTSVKPTFRYYPATKVRWKENFESPAWTLDTTLSNSVGMDTAKDEKSPYSSGRTLKATLQPGGRDFSIQSKDIFGNIQPGKPLWLEISFKTDIVLHLGIQVIDPINRTIELVPYVDLAPTKGLWNKVYVNFTNETAQAGLNKAYRIYLEAIGSEGTLPTTFYIDNIKLLYLE